MGFAGQHIISIGDFSAEDIRELLRLAHRIEQDPPPDLFRNRLMATLFFEPSTRTRLSFEAAMQKCGGTVIGFSEAAMTSARKGESLADTIRMVEQYSDVIVLRHPRDGSARLAAEVSSVPVINGGDGANQHPSQTFLDLYTIDKLFPNCFAEHEDQPLTVAFAGDLRYGRTVHSLLAALSHFHVRVLCCAPHGLEMPDHHVRLAQQQGIEVQEVEHLADAVAQADVLYMTRLQEERFPDPIEFDHVKNTYRLTAQLLTHAKPHLRVLHPLPRVNEIARDVDTTPHACYFAQAGNGIPVRQALLSLVLGLAP
ncbi:MAG: aspartate carbamoyltransferase [Planctomycetota bacterium]|nr:MAG: aspartate carbamoyltransferase [Planctomycetota bacterium]